MKEVEGDLIKLAKGGEFDVIAHGCNCFCKQESGIAREMNRVFHTGDPDYYPMEVKRNQGDMNKLGQIEARKHIINGKGGLLYVVNAYTQYEWGYDKKVRLDYAALVLCLQKINARFRGRKVGIPWIGCGLAGGDKETVRGLIETELKDCEAIVVTYKASP